MQGIYKKHLILAFAITLLTQIYIFSQTNNDFVEKNLNYNGQTAYQDLLTTKTFTFAAFGAVAAPFRSTQSLVNLLKEKQAENALQLIAKRANPEGQVYALIGLQLINSENFVPLFEDFKKNLNEKGINEISSEDGGCDSEHLALKKDEVIKKLESGEYTKTFREKFGDNKSQYNYHKIKI